MEVHLNIVLNTSTVDHYVPRHVSQYKSEEVEIEKKGRSRYMIP